MSGDRNPYPGRLGVVEEGAIADVLLADGNPLERLSLLATPLSSPSVIIKGDANEMCPPNQRRRGHDR